MVIFDNTFGVYDDILLQNENTDSNKGTGCYIVELPDEPEVEQEMKTTAPPDDEDVAKPTTIDSS